MNNYRSCKKTFRKDVAYDNIKSHEKAGLHPLSKKYISQKITAGIQSDPPPSRRVRVNLFRVLSSGDVDGFYKVRDILPPSIGQRLAAQVLICCLPSFAQLVLLTHMRCRTLVPKPQGTLHSPQRDHGP